MEEVQAQDLRFSVHIIGVYFSPKSKHAKQRIDDAAAMIRRGELCPTAFPSMHIVKDQNGIMWTLDNKRLWVFRKSHVGLIRVNILPMGCYRFQSRIRAVSPARLLRMSGPTFFPQVILEECTIRLPKLQHPVSARNKNDEGIVKKKSTRGNRPGKKERERRARDLKVCSALNPSQVDAYTSNFTALDQVPSSSQVFYMPSTCIEAPVESYKDLPFQGSDSRFLNFTGSCQMPSTSEVCYTAPNNPAEVPLQSIKDLPYYDNVYQPLNFAALDKMPLSSQVFEKMPKACAEVPGEVHTDLPFQGPDFTTLCQVPSASQVYYRLPNNPVEAPFQINKASPFHHVDEPLSSAASCQASSVSNIYCKIPSSSVQALQAYVESESESNFMCLSNHVQYLSPHVALEIDSQPVPISLMPSPHNNQPPKSAPSMFGLIWSLLGQLYSFVCIFCSKSCCHCKSFC